MVRPTVFRPLAGASAVALASLYAQPALALVQAHGAATVPALSRAASGHVRLRGTLVALHPRARVGDLALADGSMVPLRFSSAAQERRLHVGSRLLIAADAHGHARLLVRSLTIGPAGNRWWGNRWWGNRWWMHGVVTRPLVHGAAQMVGMNGAAVVVGVKGARVTDATQTAQLLAPSAAYADTRPHVQSGQAIDVQATLTRQGVLVALAVKITATHVTHIDVEGSVTAVNRAAGTVTIADEDGQKTVVAVGKAAASYRAGQNIEVGGRVQIATDGTMTLRPQHVEYENTHPSTSSVAARPTPRASATPQADDGANREAVLAMGTTGTGEDTTPTATVRTVPATTASTATSTPFDGHVTPTATATAPATAVPPTATATPTPPTATGTPWPTATEDDSQGHPRPTRTPRPFLTRLAGTATALSMETPTSTATATSTLTATDTPGVTGASTASGTPTATSTP